MTPREFVQCTDDECPMNEGRQCRAPFIMVDQDGRCIVRHDGPHENKSVTDNYVEIRECSCQKCNHWELENDGETGKCGLGAGLALVDKSEDHGPICSDYKKQIGEPGFAARL